MEMEERRERMIETGSSEDGDKTDHESSGSTDPSFDPEQEMKDDRMVVLEQSVEEWVFSST